MRRARGALPSAVKRPGIALAALLLLAGQSPTSEALCRAECDAAAARLAAASGAQAEGSCHRAAGESPRPDAPSSDCSRHAHDCAVGARANDGSAAIRFSAGATPIAILASLSGVVAALDPTRADAWEARPPDRRLSLRLASALRL